MQAVAATLKGWMQVAATVALVTLATACGGGSSGSSAPDTSGLPANPGAQPVASTAGNTAPITVASGVANVINIPTVTVTVCVPGTTQCQTISNVQVDTGSYGLRIVKDTGSGNGLNAAMQSALAISNPPGSSSGQLAECTTFADGYSWGTVRNATVQIASETATNIPIQVLGDLPDSTVPSSCISGVEENTASAIGANGILGIGVAPADCGSNCASATLAPQFSNYYACNGSSCATTPVTVPILSQVANPVARFVTDNNGVIVEMQPISQAGAASATGTLVFGINTATNNKLAAAQTFTTDGFGDLNSSTFNGSKIEAFFDSGSNAYFFADSSLPLCGNAFKGFYCPSSGQTRSVNLVGLNGVTATANVGILSAATLFGNNSNFAFNDLGGQVGMAGMFDIGLPFFYGRYMYFGIDQTAAGGQQPFVGY
jgi:membrane-bound inhibitor of C-type lysozyme